MNQKKNRRPNRPTKPKTAKNQRSPRAVREYTAGGVVYRRSGEAVEILMIQDRLGRWTIPKGHVEAGETIEQTAVREVTEETGLQDLQLGDKLDKLNFFYRREGKLIFMTTYVFVMEATGQTDALVPGDSEGIADAKWFDAGEALQLVEYRDTERLFRMALGKIRRAALVRNLGSRGASRQAGHHSTQHRPASAAAGSAMVK
jgi:8-oxo-dGTP pyrophosphatase MutT (NUDIX family)